MALLTHFPARAAVNSGFGWRNHPITGARTLHEGQDRGWAEGKDIYAARSGVVVLASYNGGYGNLVIIDHGFIGGVAYRTRYAHNASFKASVGQQVSGGQVIAVMGTTGNSTGVHNHFELRKAGIAIDPAPYFPSSGTASETGTPIETEKDHPEMANKTIVSCTAIAKAGGQTGVEAWVIYGSRVGTEPALLVTTDRNVINNLLALRGLPGVDGVGYEPFPNPSFAVLSDALAREIGWPGAPQNDMRNGYSWSPPAPSAGTVPFTLADVVQGVADELARRGTPTSVTSSQFDAAIASVNANIDDQPTEFRIVPN